MLISIRVFLTVILCLYPKVSPWIIDCKARDVESSIPQIVKSQSNLDRRDMVWVEGGKLPQNAGPVLNGYRFEMAGLDVQGFFIGMHEVTWGEWKVIREWSGSKGYDLTEFEEGHPVPRGDGSGEDHPVHHVNWYDAVKWCNALSEKEGLNPVYEVDGIVYRSQKLGRSESQKVKMKSGSNGYRLPLETEWEWAAMGGVESKNYKYPGGNNLDEVAWHRENSREAGVSIWKGRGTWPVGKKKPNELGLYDMSGNVGEWCWDAVNVNSRVHRGGYWTDAPDSKVFWISMRAFSFPDYRSYSFGFRLARSVK
jgi:sulfatase modifying factor 1